ncbi:hypothetical protein DNHGIG_23650 [Collibacillus ludicampi]|uniref:HTH cro/C1-type domain-containing protein n=1 Tax=Collibacillus ludicampi TaxID=2771369 RepID=A0AAV4LG49_9BACL|nr:helix-turn-helix transcriptional regulator [Collibacillus ludicampi]GIM46816.1 hypothetical protein DNHGIG_23650 [Collibacillus ludicampi]
MKCRLKEILEERGIKQKWLCERTGVGVSHMSRIIGGKMIPTLEVAFKIAAALGLTVHDIWEPD